MDRNDAIVIGGLGVVGTATRNRHAIPYYYDMCGSNVELEDILRCGWIFLCLPTPTVHGQADTSSVEGWISDILEHQFEVRDDDDESAPVFVIRSTVPVGFADRMAAQYKARVVSNPEFLTERYASEECNNPDIVVIGSPDIMLSREFERWFYHGVPGRRYFVSNKDAEFVKYAINCFYASKVIFANVLYEAAEEFGVNYGFVKDAMYRRKWIGQNHLTVPWEGRFGVGGRCLPKDLEAFNGQFPDPLLSELCERNEDFLARNEE